MSERVVTTGADLIRGVVEGSVPRQVRLFAAQGLLPISREELLCLQTLLTADPDEELARVATESVQGESDETILGWIQVDPS